MPRASRPCAAGGSGVRRASRPPWATGAQGGATAWRRVTTAGVMGGDGHVGGPVLHRGRARGRVRGRRGRSRTRPLMAGEVMRVTSTSGGPPPAGAGRGGGGGGGGGGRDLWGRPPPRRQGTPDGASRDRTGDLLLANPFFAG